jgi:aminoglycoside 6'-N-acetyltransferase
LSSPLVCDGDDMVDLAWRPLTADDLPLLARWLAEPGVRRWWNHDPHPTVVARDFGPSARGEEPGEDLVVVLDGRPVGLVQRSLLADYPDDLTELTRFADVPAGAVGLDYLIGDPALRGRGLGTRMIRAIVDETWTTYPLAPAVLVAVVAANVASWRMLEKAGLARVTEGPITPDNPVDDPWHVVHRIDRPAGR